MLDGNRCEDLGGLFGRRRLHNRKSGDGCRTLERGPGVLKHYAEGNRDHDAGN